MDPELSIIIVSWNTHALLRDCLQSLRDAGTRLRLEVLVVDNGSSDGSAAMCRTLFPEVCLIENRRNLGFGPANNVAVKAARGEFVLLLNSDTVVPPGTLDAMVAALRADARLGALGCRLLGADGAHQPSCMRFPTLRLLAIQELLLYRLSARLPRMFVEPPELSDLTECDWVYGAAMLVRRTAITAVDGFDPAIWMYGEEMELCYRLRARGWGIAFLPQAAVVHLGEGSWKTKDCSPNFFKTLGLLHFYRKHFSRATYLAARVLVTAGALLRVLSWGGWTLLRAVDAEKRRTGLREARTHLRSLAQAVGLRRARAITPAVTGVAETVEA